MDILAKNLRARAEQLGISNAEAARRCGLDERRYAHYISGQREPDLSTLIRIAQTLGTTPNALLGLDVEGSKATARSALIDRLVGAARSIPDRDLRSLVVQAEALGRHSER